MRLPRFLRRSGGRRDAGPVRHVSVSRTHVGRVRSINEDRVLERPEAGLWAVIDGMGGHSAGDVAAEATLCALATLADGGTPSPDAVVATLTDINRRLHEAGQLAGHVRGATIVALLLSGDHYTIFWVGDCRAYRQRGGALDLLTRDHSVVQELVDAGQLTARQAANHPRANVVTRALGAAGQVAVEVVRGRVEAGDHLLLCSDGMNRALADPPSRGAWRQELAGMADHLLGVALDKDGSDNASLVLIGCHGGEKGGVPLFR